MVELEPSKQCLNCGLFYIETSIHEVSDMCCKKCADDCMDHIKGDAALDAALVDRSWADGPDTLN